MYARGATPLRPETAGWSRPAGAVVPSSPAAIPATCVPWKDAARSTGNFPGLPAPGPGNERATITFGVVYDVSPGGKRSRAERGGERRQLQRHDHANPAARVAGRGADRAGAEARQGRLAERAPDRPEGRSRRSRGEKRRREDGESDRAAQGVKRSR